MGRQIPAGDHNSFNAIKIICDGEAGKKVSCT